MAIRGGDGSIILTTEVDTSGIDKGLTNTKSMAERTQKKIESLGHTVSKALAEGDTKTAQLANNYKKATEELEKQTAKVDELKAKLNQLESGDLKIEGKDVQRLQNELNKTNELIKKLDAQWDAFQTRSGELQANAFRAPGTNEPVLTPTEQAELDKINAQMDELEPKLESAKKKADELGVALKNATGSATQAEIEKTTQELSQAENKLGDLATKAEIAGTKLEKGTQKTRKEAKRVSDSFDKAGKKIWSLAKSALIFSAITKAFTALRETIGSALLSNEEFRTSLQQLQTSLWVVSEPLYQTILPALNSLVKGLTVAIMYVAAFFSALSGKTIQQTIESAKALNKEADAMKNLSNETKKANKQLAAFDDLQILQDKSNIDSQIVDVQKGFDDLQNLLSDSDWEKLNDFQDWVINNRDKIKTALEIGGMVALGAGIAGIITKIANLLGIFKKKDRALDIQRGKTDLETEAVGELAGAYSGAAWFAGRFLPKLNDLTEKSIDAIPSLQGLRDGITELSPEIKNAEQNAEDLVPEIDNVTQSSAIFSAITEIALDSVEDFTTSSTKSFSTWSADVQKNIKDVVETVVELQELIGEGELPTSLAPKIETTDYIVSTPAEMHSDKDTQKIIHSDLTMNTEAQNESTSATTILEKTTKESVSKTANLIIKLQTVGDKIDAWGEAIADAFESSETFLKFFGSLASFTVGVPAYAKGTVVPPNKPHLAWFGDNSNEPEVVSPVSTMKQAFTEAMLEMGGSFGGGNTEVVLEIDGREFGRAVVEQGNRENRRIGTRLVIA